MIQKLYGTVAVAALTALLAIQVSAQTTTTQSNTAAQTQAATPDPIPAPAETATPEPVPVPTPSATTTTVQPAQPVAEPAPEVVEAGIRPGSVEDFITNVGDRVFFDFDKYDLKGKDIEDLDSMVAWLKQYPHGVTVEGHCDERGTREYNLALGERRAEAVKQYLISKGIDGNKIKTVSYGKERPAVIGANELAWTFNRRAVLILN